MSKKGVSNTIFLPQRHRMTEAFVAGPIPLEWLTQAAKISGTVLEVGMKLWYLKGLNKGLPFKISNADASLCGKSAATGRRSLDALCKAGLISIEHKPGCKKVVTILETTEQNVSTGMEDDKSNEEIRRVI
jgi:hypothetical protein